MERGRRSDEKRRIGKRRGGYLFGILPGALREGETYFRYLADSASSAFQTGYCAPASSKKRLRSRFKALISSTAFIAWSEAQILPSEVAHMSLKKRRQVLR